MKQFLFYLGITGIVFASMVLLDRAKWTDEPLPIHGDVPPFSLVSEDAADFTKESLLGKVNVVSFFFTSCQGPCPKLNAELLKVQHYFEGRSDLQFVSITIDPEHDTGPVLADYEKKLGAAPGNWHFLTGDLERIQELSRGGFKLGTGKEGAKPEDLFHSTKLTLVDREGRIRGYYSSEDRQAIEGLKAAIEQLL